MPCIDCNHLNFISRRGIWSFSIWPVLYILYPREVTKGVLAIMISFQKYISFFQFYQGLRLVIEIYWKKCCVLFDRIKMFVNKKKSFLLASFNILALLWHKINYARGKRWHELKMDYVYLLLKSSFLSQCWAFTSYPCHTLVCNVACRRHLWYWTVLFWIQK